MKNMTNVLIPLVFLALFGFSIINKNFLEAALYLFVGGGFTIIYLIKANAITENLQFWNQLAWALVLLSAIMFMVVLFDDANREILKL